MQKAKQYTEVPIKEIFNKDFEKISASWDTYPVSRLKAELISYSWDITDKDWNVTSSYSWNKVKITNAKLEIVEWETQIKQKILGTRTVPDMQTIKLNLSEFEELLNSINKDASLLQEIKKLQKEEEKVKEAKRLEREKQNEEINIEDVPF